MNFVKIKQYFSQKKTKLIIYSLALMFFSTAFAMKSLRGLDGFEWQKIDASKNARMHSNLGNIFFDEKNYNAAIKEYEIAFNLVPNKTQSAVYLYNIARCYITLGNYELAKKEFQTCLEVLPEYFPAKMMLEKLR